MRSHLSVHFRICQYDYCDNSSASLIVAVHKAGCALSPLGASAELNQHGGCELAHALHGARVVINIVKVHVGLVVNLSSSRYLVHELCASIDRVIALICNEFTLSAED